MQDYYENWKKTGSAKRMIAKWVLDPEGLLTGNGFCEGVYEIKYVNHALGICTSAYIGQAGYLPTAPSYYAKDVYERILQHLKHMLGDYFTYWTGLADAEDSDWKIELHMLSEEKNHSKRLEKESEYISQNKPFLQDTADGKYELYPTKYGYMRNDLCIHPWDGQRRKAFLHRIRDIQRDKKV